MIGIMTKGVIEEVTTLVVAGVGLSGEIDVDVDGSIGEVTIDVDASDVDVEVTIGS